MPNKPKINFVFIIFAAITGSALLKQFDPETNTFNKPALSVLYGIVFIASVFIIIKDLLRKSG